MKPRRNTPKLRAEFVPSNDHTSDAAEQAEFDALQEALRKLLLDAGYDYYAVANGYLNNSDCAFIHTSLPDEAP